ncbi:hypothetical protein D7030_14530 [Flavobacteriaceae bacterium AU392]|nr:hypothetical protein D1817_03960 [Flavobacteriaceae bacterium]RKM81514.1 hypothetical protein D7030_14530 [Flavobacteriaceae bacterium AU392]
MKFENNIKDKLEERKLIPSDNAWEILQERLDSNTSKRTKKGFWWLGIAASFIGMLIVVTVFFNKNEDSELPKQLVDVEETNVLDVENTSGNKETTLQNEAVTDVPDEFESKTLETIDKIKKTPEFKKELNLKQKEIITEENKNITIAQTKTEDEIDVDKVKETKVLTIEQQQINAIVAEINKLDKASNTLNINSEVDALLQEAQKEIAFNKLYNQAIKTVDADGLLQDVEGDLQKSFRNKVFKALVDGYKDVRTAVANRNN